MIPILLGSGSFQALDRNPPVFYFEDLGISHESIDPFRSQPICYSIYHSGMCPSLCPVTPSRICLGLSSAMRSLPLSQLADPAAASLIICKLSTGMVEYALYILPRTAVWNV